MNTDFAAPSVRRTRDLALRLQTELAARGVEVAALLAAEWGGDMLPFECGEEGFLRTLVGTRPREAFDGVVGNQVHLRVEATGQFRERLHLVEAVVHAGDKDVLEGNHALLLRLVIVERGGEFLERERA